VDTNLKAGFLFAQGAPAMVRKLGQGHQHRVRVCAVRQPDSSAPAAGGVIQMTSLATAWARDNIR
jgi:hypothetical protein